MKTKSLLSVNVQFTDLQWKNETADIKYTKAGENN